jgi:hypothetical protein
MRRVSATTLTVLRTALLGVAPLWLAAAAWAETDSSGRPASGIYTCIDDKGRRLTADRPIPECRNREQQLLNRDGSLRAVVPPTLTAEERAERDLRERKLAEQRAAQADAVRRDRNLLTRYPDEAAHNRAREAAIDTVRQAIRASEVRLRELANERRPLVNEAEFYQGKTLPPKLKGQLDANDAAAEAQRSAAQNQEAELTRINRLFDTELERLRKLWAGAQPGSLGPMGPVAQAKPPQPQAQPVSSTRKTAPN